MRPRLPRSTSRLLSGPRTVTAAACPGKVTTCANCQKTSPGQIAPEKMWGIDAHRPGARGGITTSKLELVDYWLCESCFCAGGAKAVQP